MWMLASHLSHAVNPRWDFWQVLSATHSEKTGHLVTSAWSEMPTAGKTQTDCLVCSGCLADYPFASADSTKNVACQAGLDTML